MLYDLLKICTSILFNLLNRMIGGHMPPLGSACALVEQDGRYLAVELPRHRVVFPGGFMTWREQPWQTAEREVREETGLHVRATELVGVYPTISDSFTRISNLCFAYRAEVVDGTLRGSPEGRPCWLTESEVRRRFNKGDQRILDDYLGKRDHQATSLTRLGASCDVV